MSTPIITIVGRPNVGKSTLFNAMIGKRLAIVDPTAGVTRDRLSVEHQHEDRTIEIVDTGGIGIIDHPGLAKQIEQQIRYALDAADLILFVVDSQVGVTPLDRKVAQLLRSRTIPIILVANKSDNTSLEIAANEFHALGFDTPFPISARGRMGIRALLDQVIERLPESSKDPVDKPEPMKIAMVGKRNVGKSTFINALAGEERVIANEIPGTTRDSIDVQFEKGGLSFVAIDTAGIRKKRKAEGSIEYYGMVRSERSIRRADVVLFLVDAAEPVGQVDRRIADQIRTACKPCAIVVNKWDLAQERGIVTERYDQYLAKTLPGMTFAPIIFTTAMDGRNIFRAIDLARSLFKKAQKRISTGPLNRAVKEAYMRRRPRVRKGLIGKIYYAVQVRTLPPTFLLFVNSPKLFEQAYYRYMENSLREDLGFEEIPLRVVFRTRKRFAKGSGARHEVDLLEADIDSFPEDDEMF
ncbi:MAG: ribosome biogenesis GTPase Der [Planctomycetota bacterium]|jgi:GTP-binding protein|nr:ribosome biogenesis GTPase Der [Planctomycetota bacterium]